MIRKLVSTNAPAAALLTRLAVGKMFLSGDTEIPISRGGVGRFIKIGIHAPEFMAPFVGALEIGCGALLLAGCLFLLVVGAGAWPADARWSVKARTETASETASRSKQGIIKYE
jgi:uncharacterized membrane protein YphA (DoxX/SURF4 family)